MQLSLLAGGRCSPFIVRSWLLCAVVLLAVPSARAGWFDSAPFQPVALRCEYEANPLGIDEPHPRLAWQMQSARRGERQTAWRLLVASSPALLRQDRGDLWDSGKVAGDETIGADYAGAPLVSQEHCFWKVCEWNQDDHAVWSQPAEWSMGLLQPADWQADWIGYDQARLQLPIPPIPPGKDGAKKAAPWLPPAPYLRTTFQAGRSLLRATLYVSALGLVEAHLNGRPVGDEFFTPGWSDYDQRVHYRTYDVTRQIRPGANALGAILADGWYSGYIGFDAKRNYYGALPRVRLQLQLDYVDGSHTIIGTGPAWKAALGPVLEADLLKGETYDARQELTGWDQPGFPDDRWQPVVTGGEIHPLLQAHPGPPVRVIAEFKARTVAEPTNGVYVFDLGQNFAGVARLKVSGEPGQTITLRFAERLNPNGMIYTNNLRAARVTDTYICRGRGVEVWEPRFTYHGFQYIEVTGLKKRPALDLVTGLALSSDTPVAGAFDCSDPMLNQLHRNIYWTQRANFMDIPTDCPQRDERLGWTGDAQVYIRTATLNCDVAGFYTKWLTDLADGQRADGQFPCVAPLKVAPDDGGPAWSDAGVICPWTLYETYGDRRILEQHYASMTNFIAFCERRSRPGLLPPVQYHIFGDWLSIKAATSNDVICTAYFACSTKLTARTAEVLGHTADAARYNNLFDRLKTAFNQAYVTDDGVVTGDTQTGYVLALAFDLVDGDRARRAAQHLIDNIASHDWHLTTGFIGTKDLMLVLAKIGRNDVAYRLIHKDTFPSWGFSIKNGATSIWERWDGWTPDKGFQDPGMNSFAHYSFGAVYQWMVENIGGLHSTALAYHHLLIAPQLDDRLTRAATRYDSIRGPISTTWQRHGDRLTLDLSIPANTAATVLLPAADPDTIQESGRPLTKAAGVNFFQMKNGCAVLAVVSGQYHFASQLKP